MSGFGNLLVVICAVVIGGGLWLFYFVGTEHPHQADAIVVLSGNPGRLATGLRLLRQHIAPTLLISLPQTADRSLTRTCETHGVDCFHAVHYSTRGEAEAVGRLAARHHWSSIVIVSSRFHLRRARLLFSRCTDAALQVVPAHTTFWEYVRNAPLEAGKLAVQLTLDRSC